MADSRTRAVIDQILKTLDKLSYLPFSAISLESQRLRLLHPSRFSKGAYLGRLYQAPSEVSSFFVSV